MAFLFALSPNFSSDDGGGEQQSILIFSIV